MESVGILGMTGIVIARDPLPFLLTGGALAGTLLVGALIISWVGRWRKRASNPEILSPSDELATYRKLYEEGELSEEEFEQLRAHLGGKIRKEAQAETRGEPSSASPAPLLPPRSEAGLPPVEPPSNGIQPG